MSNNRPHPLLEQVPLTVSPFVSLPTAPTLSYNYKPMPSTLPPSAVEPHNPGAGAANPHASPPGEPSMEKAQFIVSPSGHAAHPDDIIASCRALHMHLSKMQEDADTQLREWEERMRQRDLAEKRRVAPGWLDREERLLEPERAVTEGVRGLRIGEAGGGGGESRGKEVPEGVSEMAAEGEELDRVFGGASMRQ